MKKLLVAVTLIFFILLPSLSTAETWFKDSGKLPLPGFPAESYVKVTTIGTAIGIGLDTIVKDKEITLEWFEGKTTFVLRGVGTVLPGGYILTAAHVVDPEKVSVIGNIGGYKNKPVKVLDKIITITRFVGLKNVDEGIPAKIVYIDKEFDNALLKYSEGKDNRLNPIPYSVGKTYSKNDEGLQGPFEISKLVPGNAIATIVRKRDENYYWTDDFEVRYGTVLSVRPEGKFSSLYSSNEVVANLRIYKGDSGSPIFAFDNEKGPVVVGVVTAAPPVSNPLIGSISNIAYFSRLDFIKIFLSAKRKFD